MWLLRDYLSYKTNRINGRILTQDCCTQESRDSTGLLKRTELSDHQIALLELLQNYIDDIERGLLDSAKT